MLDVINSQDIKLLQKENEDLKNKIKELENNNKAIIQCFESLKLILNRGVLYHNGMYLNEFNKNLEELGIIVKWWKQMEDPKIIVDLLISIIDNIYKQNGQ